VAEIVEQRLSLHHVAVPAQPDAALVAALEPGLSAARLRQLQVFRRDEDRLSRLLAGALCAAAALERQIRFDPEDIEHPTGLAIRWINGPACSLSHTAQGVVLLVADEGPVGVDLETAGAAVAQDLRLVLPVGLRAALESGRLDPTDIWVRTEAALKAVGRGLSGLHDLEFEHEDRARVGVVRVALRAVDVADGQRCCCALPMELVNTPMTVHLHTVDDLVGLLQAARRRRIPAPEGAL
jgi:phosphopantetheinyl transferase